MFTAPACRYVLLRIRKEVVENGKTAKTFWIEPKGAELCLWNEDCLREPSDAPLIITEGELDALSFLAAGATHVVSVPNGATLDKPGEGDIVPRDDRAFRYLWDGVKLKAGLQPLPQDHPGDRRRPQGAHPP